MAARLPPSDAEEFSLASLVPATAQTVTLRIKIFPMRGTAFVYRSLYDTRPVRCTGPAANITVSYGSGKLYLERTNGATRCMIEVLAWSA